MKVKIFGERNCGTRVLAVLLQKNLGAEIFPSTAAELDPWGYDRLAGDIEAGIDIENGIDAIFRNVDAAHSWKHCATNFEDVGSFADCLTIFLVKHPLSWLVSLFDRPYHQIGPGARTVAELAGSSWQTVERERLNCRAYKPFDLYREKIASYLDLAPRIRSVFVRFEDVVSEPEKVVRELGLKGPFNPHEQSTKDQGKTLVDYRIHYAEERWRQKVADLTDHPDWDQVRKFGYR